VRGRLVWLTAGGAVALRYFARSNSLPTADLLMKSVAIITGATGGIGKAIVQRLAQDGAAVVIHYSGSADRAQAAAQEIVKSGGKAIALGADVSKSDEVKALFAKARRELGDITAVVHTAGIMPLAPIKQGDMDMFDKVITTNLRGTFVVMSQAANQLAEGGRIVVFSSSVLAKSFPTYGAYIASKAGAEGLVKVLANELGERKITVNAVAPGPVATPLFLKGKSQEQIEQMGKLAPLGRIGEPEDIAGVVAFLVGKDGGWVNGQVLRVNGGFA
jgi:3-oxoacyl-[acyl-carrier protein] reductase